MNRTIVRILIALATLTVPVSAAYADEAAPTKEQLDAAKKAFAEGKSLHDQGKLNEAIEKFKESYRLSKNPLLLYNIGFTLDEAGQKDTALFYYRKFLSDAPANAQQRKTVADRVKVIEQEKLDADLNGTGAPTPPATGTTAVKTEPTKPAEHAEPKAVKPAGTYTAADFQHQLIEEAPPGKPLDLTASVPEDSGFTVTLYYRRSGESAFTQKPMKWRYKELVARIPATKVTADLQYYIEVKDAGGNVVTRSGKSTSPNLITMSPGATPRFYPDITDEGEKVSPEQTKRHDEEDPLGGNKTQDHDDAPIGGGGATTPDSPTTPGNGLTDVGSSKFKYAKWGTTATAAGLIGLGVTFYILAKGQASNLENDAKHDIMGNPCTSPCHVFDSAYDQQVQDAGKRDQTISNIGLGVGVGVAVVAGYFWYRELTAKKHGELKVSKNGSPEATWVVAPSITEGFTGAAAAARF